MNCEYCGAPWVSGKPLVYHGPENRKNSWHCDTYLCSIPCEECQEWFAAIGGEDKSTGGKQEMVKLPTLPPVAEAPVIMLSDEELSRAYRIGEKRQVEAERLRLKHKYGFAGDYKEALLNHQEGAAGELAVSKYLEVRWDESVNTFKSRPDLPFNIEVRTRMKWWYECIVRENDKDDEYVVRVGSDNPLYTISGYILAGNGKRPEWKKKHGGREEAYFVPFENLMPISWLKEIIKNG